MIQSKYTFYFGRKDGLAYIGNKLRSLIQVLSFMQ